jgi:Predicted membrane protein
LRSGLWAGSGQFLDCVGDSGPLPWLPLLNQFDLTILAAIAVPLIWLRSLYTMDEFRELLRELQLSITAVFSAVSFAWLNGILARSLHYWGEIPFTAHGMLHSPLAQASFSIFWSLLALLATLYAVRHSNRLIWLCGATLLGVVVAKLFMIDLAGHGTIARIVSFVAVGLLLLVIGWFAPVPPKQE